MRPPCISISRLASDSPIPSPPRERATASSVWANITNTLFKALAGMPMPLSFTRTSTSQPVSCARISIKPPPSVYLAALVSRFMNT